MSCRHRLPPTRQRGFTAVELLFTLAIVALVTALAVPSFRNFTLNNRAADEANALVGALALARSEAVTRGTPVSVCSSADNSTCSGSDDWTTGWIVFTDADASGDVNDDDAVLRAVPALRSGSELAADAAVLTYAPNGFLNAAATVDFDLAIEECTGNHNRTINVNPQGRAAVASAPCG